jgi:tetratricopeptide (TPR) repeat protein
MLASCYMEKGVYSLAIEEFRKVLAGVPPASPVYYEIKYDLARAFMLNENHAQALQLYSEIEAENSGFKDVASRISALKQKMAAQTTRPRPRRDRVSYI